MTRDCGHSTGAETRDIVQEMTRDCGPLGREGERVPEFDRYPLPLPRSCPSFLLPGPASVTAGCPLRMREKRCAL
ncbi:unnamed protein product [Staurois parvus]|uniref:Uncharacterized protein n=1 Tax=Staurois parvus TaxID=386267 RepID=A0ABN9BNY0_9NEOB|nr:unnamed protein product [Staurois parvus]